MVLKTGGGGVRKLGSQLHPAWITSTSTQWKNRKDKVCFEEHSVNLPSSPCIISPMSLHTIAHLRDVEFEDSNNDKVVTATKQKPSNVIVQKVRF
jgi:hypothetical protein